ncbi:MAG: class I SAM-dependent methyltransferase [Ramlibacter sp.]
MSTRPPTIDPIAAARWTRVAPPRSPWLHDEVARRMAERLEWIRLAPATWAHWEPVRGGLAAQPLLEQRYPKAACTLVEPEPARLAAAREAFATPWWKRWGGPRREFAPALPDAGVQMLWANMALHTETDPEALLARWHKALAVDGFLMFSCLGPDSLRELHAVYAALGWGPPGPLFTDMHDWGDMLVAGGFAEPVMDMERVTLTWADADRLLAELRELGANLHPARFGALRGRGWERRLKEELVQRLAGPDGRLALTFEIVYCHALRPTPRMPVSAHSTLSLDDMRRALQSGGRGAKSSDIRD